MAQILIPGLTANLEESGPFYCLICLGKAYQKDPSVKQTGMIRTPVDLLIKICEMLNVSFSEIEREWEFKGCWSQEKYPFCYHCLSVVESVIDQQDQIDALQRKVVTCLSEIRSKIRLATGIITAGGTEEVSRLQNFRTRAIRHSDETDSTPAFINTLITSTPGQLIIGSWSSSYTPLVSNADIPIDGQAHSEIRTSDPPEGRTCSQLQTFASSGYDPAYTPRQPEHFAPIVTDSSGRMTFEGVSITQNPSGGYTCGLCKAVCGKRHDSIALRKTKIHIKGFHLGAYKCSICSKNFTSNDILSQHVSRTHQVEDAPCDICGKSIRPRYMLLHKFTHMNSEEKADLVASGFKPPVSSADKVKKHPCEKCGAMFKKMTHLRIHARTHMDSSLRPKELCPHCEKSYSTSQSLKDHIKRCHPTRFTVASELRRREECKICKKKVFPRAITRHMRTHVAPENKPLACKICAQRFQDETSLKRHESLQHETGETPDQLQFSCDICGKRAATEGKVRAHRKRVHSDNWKSKFPPQLVAEVTVDNSHYQCKVCGKTLRNLTEVKVHKKEHDQIDSYTCCICEKPGIPRKSLRGHEFSHKNVWEAAQAINQGEMLPRKGAVLLGDKSLDVQEVVLKKLGEPVEYNCLACGEHIFGLDLLDRHVREKHPERKKRKLYNWIDESVRKQDVQEAASDPVPDLFVKMEVEVVATDPEEGNLIEVPDVDSIPDQLVQESRRKSSRKRKCPKVYEYE